MRSIGYSFEAAIADVIDNSIDAGAKRISIDVDVVNGEYIAILDDGKGMTFDVGVEALRIAGNTDHEGEERLGRFGLGLKTASLSQGRQVTVVSKQGKDWFALQWDIDNVLSSGNWTLTQLDLDEIPATGLLNELINSTSGTLVVWRKLDLLVGDATDVSAALSAKIGPLNEHLSLTFHRFLGGLRKKCTLYLNGVQVEPVDPFLTTNPKTQISPIETIVVGGSDVTFTVFTLPHVSGLTPEERQRPDLGSQMRDFQGFYIYRNNRLLSRGHWFGLASKNELTKQTRIQVDIPSSLDDLWQIDVKKSRAEPPASFKSHLKTMIEPLLMKGRRVHTFRGRKTETSEVSHLWQKLKDREGFFYEINLENPLLKSVLSNLPQEKSEQLVELFEALARQFPLLDAYQEMASNNVPAQPVWGREELRSRLIMLKKSGALPSDAEYAVALLAKTEPFDSHEGLDALVKEVWDLDAT
jgi:hypothetical protein